MICATCEQDRPIKGRGLCGACYIKLWRMGKLAAYPRQKWGTRQDELTRLRARIAELEAHIDTARDG